jgi:hypothetical protein
MPKSKKIIKVVDIVAVDAFIEADKIIVDIEKGGGLATPTEGQVCPSFPIEIAHVDIETEEVTPELISPLPIKNELKTMVKISDLTECEKCHKMIKNKTLKYSHFKTCGIVKIAKTPIAPIAPIAPIETPITPITPIETPITPITPIETPVIKKAISAIRQVKKPVVIKQPISVQQPPPIITLDQIRTEYFNNVKQQRTMMMQKLFSNAI